MVEYKTPLHPSVKILREGEVFIVQWNNRSIPTSRFVTIFILVFGLFWTAFTIQYTRSALSGNVNVPFAVFWLTFGYLGVILLGLKLIVRCTWETIAFDESEYRHIFPQFPWIFPKRWPVDEIDRITLGRVKGESNETLNIWSGQKRDNIAFWAKTEIKRDLFNEIKRYVEEVGLDINVDNMNGPP